MAYTRLMRAYYRREKPFIDLDEACRLVRAISKKLRAAVQAVLNEFFNLQADGWHNKRCDAEIVAYQTQATHNREVGNLGGRPKKTKVVSKNNHSGFKKKPIDNPNQEPEPLTTNQEPETSNSKSTPLASSDKPLSADVPVNGAFYIPLADKTQYAVSGELIAELEAAYPAVDIPSTMREIRAWCVTNPEKCKTARGAPRFLNRWFEKVQNSG